MSDTSQRSQFYTELATGAQCPPPGRGRPADLRAPGQGPAGRPAMPHQAFGLLLRPEVVRPGEGLRRGEKESSFNAPVRGQLCAL